MDGDEEGRGNAREQIGAPLMLPILAFSHSRILSVFGAGWWCVCSQVNGSHRPPARPPGVECLGPAPSPFSSTPSFSSLLFFPSSLFPFIVLSLSFLPSAPFPFFPLDSPSPQPSYGPDIHYAHHTLFTDHQGRRGRQPRSPAQLIIQSINPFSTQASTAQRSSNQQTWPSWPDSPSPPSSCSPWPY